MDNQLTPIINIMTYSLPLEVSRPIYNEFQSRFTEAKRVIKEYSGYQVLKNDLDLVELLLAMSIFHNRVLVNLDAATKFFGLVTRSDIAESVKIGNYRLDQNEISIIQKTLINNKKILRKYNMDESLFSYQLTIDFLQKLIQLKSMPDGRTE